VILRETILPQVMSAKESLLVDCLASNPVSKDFVSFQHVVKLLRPPGTPRLRLSENTNHVSCSARAGNPTASLTLYLDGEVLKSEQMKQEEEDDVTTFAKLEATNKIQHVVCEAKNEVTSVPLRSEVFVAPAATSAPMSLPSNSSNSLSSLNSSNSSNSAISSNNHQLDPTQPPRAQAQEDKRRKVRRRQKMAPVYEMPLADMPPKDDIPEDYDYSHFEYINKKFEDTFSKSATEPQEMEYFSYDYVYYSEGSVDEEEEMEEKVVKVVEKEEDKVLIVEEGASTKSSSSGTILVSGSFLSLLVLLRLV